METVPHIKLIKRDISTFRKSRISWAFAGLRNISIEFEKLNKVLFRNVQLVVLHKLFAYLDVVHD